MLLCLVCLFDLACFFLSSFSSLSLKTCYCTFYYYVKRMLKYTDFLTSTRHVNTCLAYAYMSSPYVVHVHIHIHNYIVGEDMVTCNTMLYHLSYMHQLSYIYMYTCTMYIYIYIYIAWCNGMFTCGLTELGPLCMSFLHCLCLCQCMSSLPVSLPVREFSAVQCCRYGSGCAVLSTPATVCAAGQH